MSKGNRGSWGEAIPGDPDYRQSPIDGSPDWDDTKATDPRVDAGWDQRETLPERERLERDVHLMLKCVCPTITMPYIKRAHQENCAAKQRLDALLALAALTPPPLPESVEAAIEAAQHAIIDVTMHEASHECGMNVCHEASRLRDKQQQALQAIAEAARQEQAGELNRALEASSIAEHGRLEAERNLQQLRDLNAALTESNRAGVAPALASADQRTWREWADIGGITLTHHAALEVLDREGWGLLTMREFKIAVTMSAEQEAELAREVLANAALLHQVEASEAKIATLTAACQLALNDSGHGIRCPESCEETWHGPMRAAMTGARAALGQEGA